MHIYIYLSVTRVSRRARYSKPVILKKTMYVDSKSCPHLRSVKPSSMPKTFKFHFK